MGKRHRFLVGKPQHPSPPLPTRTPCHSKAELFSISSLKVWGNVQKPHCDIAYLLVRVENTMTDRHYGISLVWVNPNHVRAATMEEAVEKLTACTSNGNNWPYTLAQLYEGPCHALLPKDKHLGILPQGKVEETPCGQISQLKVCQLLPASPQVIYPIGLNGHDESIITTLPELLDSGISLTGSEHIYLEIDIPSLPVEEPDQKIPPLGKVSTILITSPHKSPLKLEGSMTTEVSNLLSQAVLEASSCESKCSSPRRPTTAAVLTTPPQKPEGPLHAVDTSSQVSVKEAEASLEDIPTTISPIPAISKTRSVSPLMDLAELWTNTNRALDDLLNTKGSIDARKWRAVWELGVILCQNESQVATKSSVLRQFFDTQTACSWLILEAKTDFLGVVKKAKTTRGHLVQEAEAACSKTICEVEAQKVSQAAIFHEEHGKYMGDLEEQPLERRRSHNDFLSACQVIFIKVHHSLKELWLPHITFYWSKHLCCLHSSCHRRLLPWRNSQLQPLRPHQHPNNLLSPKGDTLCQIPWRACLWAEPLQRLLWEDPPSPKRWEIPPWFKTLNSAVLRHLANIPTW